MKIYVVMHANCKTSWRGIAQWRETHTDDGFVAYLRLKDAKRVVDRVNTLYKTDLWRVVTFETDDVGKDARERKN